MSMVRGRPKGEVSGGTWVRLIWTHVDRG